VSFFTGATSALGLLIVFRLLGRRVFLFSSVFCWLLKTMKAGRGDRPDRPTIRARMPPNGDRRRFFAGPRRHDSEETLSGTLPVGRRQHAVTATFFGDRPHSLAPPP